ncbi:MAG: inner membrane CreD family protein [Vulcanimicrobiota bacterium]
MRYTTLFLIYLLASFAWVMLGLRLQARHQGQDARLRAAVADLWGASHRQEGPTLMHPEGKVLALDSTRATVELALEYRRKGMLWYSTYRVNFDAKYQLECPVEGGRFHFPLPARGGMYSDFSLAVDGQPVEGQLADSVLVLPVPKGKHEVEVRLSSQGLDSWSYQFRKGSPTRSLDLVMHTNFTGVDFPDGTVSPVSQKSYQNGLELKWSYAKLLTGATIGVELPHRSNPGPRLISLCLWAPVGLLLFLGLTTVFAMVDRVDIQPLHYFLLVAGFFSFHLLLVYLGDVVNLAWAFGLAGAASSFVCVSYARRVTGSPFAYKRAAPALALSLVTFSLAFLSEAYRGLLLVVLLVVCLHVVMQVTAGFDWDEVASNG